MAFALSHSTMRARSTREDPLAGHIRALAVMPHAYERDHRLWTGDKPPSLQTDWLFCVAGAYMVNALAALDGSYGLLSRHMA
jgi:hypothetical protein